jgi:hypothetical protein
MADEFSLRQLVISSIVGAVAGVLAAISMSDEFFAGGAWKPLDMKVLLGLAAAGYAGADFIEAAAGKYFGDGTSGGDRREPAAKTEPAAGGAVG